jgi:hypothetical protein
MYRRPLDLPKPSTNWPSSSDTGPRGSVHLGLASANATVPFEELEDRGEQVAEGEAGGEERQGRRLGFLIVGKLEK